MPRTNTAPLSGTRDFLPLEVMRRNYVIAIVERIYQSYGFEPLETPTMERLETLLGKYGEEGDQLIFRVMKRGDKLQRALSNSPQENDLADSGLRYDLTVPLARVVAEYQAQLPRILKRYQIQPVYRADRPARGRYREFYQCDVDIVGSDDLLVEAEVIAAGARVLQELGFNQPEDFRIRLNHRLVLKGLMQIVGVASNLETEALVALDKYDRIGAEGVQKELSSRGIGAEAAHQLLQLIAEEPHEKKESLAWLQEHLQASTPGIKGVTDLRLLWELLETSPAGPHVDLDPYLARGLSYYTGPIFEVGFPGYSGSAGGGGRYDDLIGMFSGRSIPACGFSLGLERVLLILEERNMFPPRLQGQPQVLVTRFDKATSGPSLELAHELRSAGLRVDLYTGQDRYGKQFKYADQRQIQYALLLGPDEHQRNVVAVKDLRSGEQVDVPRGDLIPWLKERLG